MTARTSVPERTAMRAAILDRLHTLSRRYPHQSLADLRRDLAPLLRQADAAGYQIVAGLGRALNEALIACPCRDCPPVFLHYMTRALTLEPSSDRDILNLLLVGVRRQLREVQHCHPLH